MTREFSANRPLGGFTLFMTDATDRLLSRVCRDLHCDVSPQEPHTSPGSNFPLLLTACSDTPLAALLNEQSAEDLLALLRGVGAVVFRGYPLTGDEGFDQVLSALPLDPFTYSESFSNAVRRSRTERVFTANEAPPEVEIFLHHEMAQTLLAPRYLAFYAEVVAATGGATPLCQSEWLLDHLDRLLPDFTARCRRLGVRYTHTMPVASDSGSGQGRSWRDTLSVGGREEAEMRLQALGYGFEWLAGDELRVTTPALAAVRSLAPGREVFFNQLVAAFAGWRDRRNQGGNAVSFGDGSPIPEQLLDTVVEAAYEHAHDHCWAVGDIALLDNLQVMHGRRPFTGQRVVLAGLAGPMALEPKTLA